MLFLLLLLLSLGAAYDLLLSQCVDLAGGDLSAFSLAMLTASKSEEDRIFSVTRWAVHSHGRLCSKRALFLLICKHLALKRRTILHASVTSPGLFKPGVRHGIFEGDALL